MDWINLIGMVITSGLLVTILEFLYYKRFNKAIKKNEAKSGDLDNQMKSIDLGKTFLEQIQALNDAQKDLQEQQRKMWAEGNKERSDQWAKQSKKIDNISTIVESLKVDVENIKNYLNGGLKAYTQEQSESKEKKKPSKQTNNKNKKESND